MSTPLAIGIKKAFPNAEITYGVGNWAKPLLLNNPYIDHIQLCNAPWHNKQNCRYPANSPRTFIDGIFYILFSKEARTLSKERFMHGLDILGSRQGSWLLKRIGIPLRYGVRGYAGGHKWCTHFIDFHKDRHVSEGSLAFLKLMNAEVDIEPRPFIRLFKHEIEEAESVWGNEKRAKMRLIIAPGGGFPEKCWGDQNYTNLTKLLIKDKHYQICIIGAEEDKNRIRLSNDSKILNLCGKLSIRKSAALVSQSDYVVTNTSLCMHLAGAFKVPSLTILGDWYDSACIHQKQWGYPECTILGKEKSVGNYSISSVDEAYACVVKKISVYRI